MLKAVKAAPTIANGLVINASPESTQTKNIYQQDLQLKPKKTRFFTLTQNEYHQDKVIRPVAANINEDHNIKNQKAQNLKIEKE